MSLFQRNIISNQVIKAKSDKLMKRTLRDARKEIKQGVLVDSQSLALYLHTIDARFTHIRADINHATRVANYTKVRADKTAETRQLLAFFSQDCTELDRLSQIVAQKAEEAGRIDDFKHEKLSSIDLTKLKDNFDALTREENKDGTSDE